MIKKVGRISFIKVAYNEQVCFNFLTRLYMKNKYDSTQCQKCGEHIGWLGRFIEWVYCGLIKHECKPRTKN